MVAAFRMKNHIYCIDHLLHNTLQKSINDVPAVSELSNSCSKLVKYFKVTGQNANLDTTLKSFSPTRWNTIYYLFVSVQNNWSEIIQILQQKNELHRTNNINLNSITALITLLEHFEETFKKLEGEKYVTIHLVYIYIYRLKKKCNADIEDLQIVKDLKIKIIEYIDSLVLKNLTIYHKIALFLYPPLNKLIQFSEEEKCKVKEECKRMMRNYFQEQSELENQSEEAAGISSHINEFYSDFLPQSETFSGIDSVSNELVVYESLNISIHEDFNILQWWHLHKNEFPLLYKVSCKILATPASSAPSERVFSVARNLISEKRCSIASNGGTVNNIMFLHSNIDSTELRNALLN